MNVFAVVASERWADALAAAVKTLREFGVDDVAVVAQGGEAGMLLVVSPSAG